MSAAQSAVLLLDDSLSMNYQPEGGGRLGGGGTLLGGPKKRAAQLVEALPPGAEAALVLGTRGTAAPVPELTGDRARLFSALSAVQPSYRAADLHAALKRAAQILQTVRRSQRRIYLFSPMPRHTPSMRPGGASRHRGLGHRCYRPANRAIVEGPQWICRSRQRSRRKAENASPHICTSPVTARWAAPGSRRPVSPP